MNIENIAEMLKKFKKFFLKRKTVLQLGEEIVLLKVIF